MAKSVLIVGGGVIGLSAALYCVRQGYQVTVLDRNGPDAGCSHGNAGMIVPSHFIPLAAPGMVALALRWMWNPESPFYIKPRFDTELLRWGLKFYRAATAAHVVKSAPLLRDLSLASRACFEEFAATSAQDFGLVKKGLLMLCKSPSTFREESKVAEQARALGIPAEVLDAAATAALEPKIRMDIAGSVYFPKDCHLSPSLFLGALRAEIEKAGAGLLWGTEVIGWRTSNRRIEAVRTAQGELTADEFVLSGGSWSGLTASSLGLKLPLQAGKGYSLTLPQPRQLPEICSILTEARVAVTPMNGRLRVGGTMELAGLNQEINPMRVQGIIKALPRYFPDFTQDDFHELPVWCGLRPCSPDGLPYLGRTARLSNLCIATGHAMMGLSLGPISGKVVGEILAGKRPSIDLAMLNPDRYN